jgi:hypothetical protein
MHLSNSQRYILAQLITDNSIAQKRLFGTDDTKQDYPCMLLSRSALRDERDVLTW